MEDKDIEYIKRNLVELKQSMATCTERINKVVTHLRGNDFDPKDNGMMGQVEDHGVRIKKLEKLKDRAFWIFLGAFFMGWGLPQIFEAFGMVIKSLKH